MHWDPDMVAWLPGPLLQVTGRACLCVGPGRRPSAHAVCLCLAVWAEGGQGGGRGCAQAFPVCLGGAACGFARLPWGCSFAGRVPPSSPFLPGQGCDLPVAILMERALPVLLGGGGNLTALALPWRPALCDWCLSPWPSVCAKSLLGWWPQPQLCGASSQALLSPPWPGAGHGCPTQQHSYGGLAPGGPRTRPSPLCPRARGAFVW